MIRIAHLSDLQLGSWRGTPLSAFLGKRLWGAAHWAFHRRRIHAIWALQRLIADVNDQKPDHVVVTGDLSNLSLESEFASVRALLSELSLPPSEVTVVPGNHDAYVPSAASLASFVSAFRPYLTGDDGRAGVFPFLRVRDGVAVIGLSTAVPRPLGQSSGSLGETQLSALERLLRSRAVAGRFRVVAMHHPPLVHRGGEGRQMADRERFRQVVARAGCELVVHGHEHRDVEAVLTGPEGPIPCIGAGSASHASRRFSRAARYRLYEIAGDTLRATSTRVPDPAGGAVLVQ